jgi:redox-sensitive bicupin YhaK (pirin superfamily)
VAGQGSGLVKRQTVVLVFNLTVRTVARLEENIPAGFRGFASLVQGEVAVKMVTVAVSQAAIKDETKFPHCRHPALLAYGLFRSAS